MLVHNELASESTICRHAEAAFQTTQKPVPTHYMLSHAVQVSGRGCKVLVNLPDEMTCLKHCQVHAALQSCLPPYMFVSFDTCDICIQAPC